MTLRSTDSEWLDGIRRRDSASLGMLYDAHAAHVYRVAARILRDTSEAEEVTQDVFLQVWSHPERFDAVRGSLLAWLTIMARSRSLDRLRAARARGAREHTVARRTEEAVVAAPHPEDVAIRASVAGVPALQRVPLELAFFEGLTHGEVAALLRQPVGTVKTRIRLALRKVRQTMDAAPGTHRDIIGEAPFTVALAEYLARNPIVKRSLTTLDGVRVLVVDDDTDTRDLVATVLSCAGADVRAAGSASEALARLAAQHYDVMVADISMPHRDGYSLMREARRLGTRTAVPLRAAAFTAKSTGSDRAAALAAGFDAHIAKPVRPDAIVRVVVNLMTMSAPGDGDRHQPPAPAREQ